MRWVPLYSFQTLSLRPFAMDVAFLRSDYYGLFDCLEGLGVSLGSRFPTLHPPSHPCQALPCSTYRTQAERFRWCVSMFPNRSLRLPHVGTGYVRLTSTTFHSPAPVVCVGSYSHMVSDSMG